MTRRTTAAWVAIAVFSIGAVVGAFQARTIAAAAMGLLTGLAHPFLRLDHLLAAIAIGLSAVLVAERAVRTEPLWAVPGTFLAVMTAAGIAGFQGISLPYTAAGFPAALVILGASIAFAPRLPVWGAMLLAAVVGVFDGYANGIEVPETASMILYGLGFFLSTAALDGIGVALGLIFHDTHLSPAVLRVGGIAVAAAAVARYLVG